MSSLLDQDLFPSYYRRDHLQSSQNALSRPQNTCNANPSIPLKEVCSKAKPNSKQPVLAKFINFDQFTLAIVSKDRKHSTLGEGVEARLMADDEPYLIRSKSKRILFNKELSKGAKDGVLKISLNNFTGQVQMTWPSGFYFSKRGGPYHQKNRQVPKVITQAFVEEFSLGVAPILQKIMNEYPGKRSDQSEQLKLMKKCQKYLNMSSVPYFFSKEKESFQKVQSNQVQIINSLVQLQSSIDFNFGFLGRELQMFSLSELSTHKARLCQFGELSFAQREELNNLSEPIQDRSHCNQEQYVLNCIGVLKIENKKNFVNCGGSCAVYLIKIIFQYVFSDDPKFWLEENKKLKSNIIEKSFAMKEPKNRNEPNQKTKIQHEKNIIKLMKGGYSRHLPKYYKIEEIENKKSDQEFILMDFLNGATLNNYIQSRVDYISFWSKLYLIRSIINGLQFLSSYKIVHMDFKPTNVVVMKDMLVKLVDFGESYNEFLCKKQYQPGVSLPYCCPEVFNQDSDFKESCDVFSLGIIMAELFFQRLPFDIGKEKLASIYKKKSIQKHFFLSAQHLEQNNLQPMFHLIMSMVLRCIDPDPEKRPTLAWLDILIKKCFSCYRPNS